MRRLACALALLGSSLAAHATFYFVSNSGSDSNPGTGTLQPWQTVAKVNAECTTKGAIKPGDSILFQAGGVWHEQLSCGDTQNPASGSTITTVPPYFAGTQAAPIIIGSYGTGAQPIIDAADMLTGTTWVVDPNDATGHTYSAPIPKGWNPACSTTSACGSGYTNQPTKLYVDSATTEAQALLPVPNYVGVYVSGTNYPYLTATSSTPTSAPCWYGGLTGNSASPCYKDVFSNGYATAAGNSPWYGEYNTAEQNVIAGENLPHAGYGAPTYPGVWGTDGTTMWVHLADNSNPNAHSFEGTHRSYNILLQNTSWITIQNLTLVHAHWTGLLAFEYAASGGTYDLGDGISVQGVNVWNYGNILATDILGQQGNQSVAQNGGIMLRGPNDNGYYPQDVVVNNVYAGISDAPFPFGNQNGAGVDIYGMNGPRLTNSFMRTLSTGGMQVDFNMSPVVTGNQFTQNQGNYFANNSCTSSAPALFTNNNVHDEYAEGIQLGGGPAGGTNSSCEHVTHNVIANIGLGADTDLYNNIDCNGGLNTGIEIGWNTLVNGYAAAVTLEGGISPTEGCQAAHVHDNIMDMNHVNYGVDASGKLGSMNASNANFMATPTDYAGSTWDHNLYIMYSGNILSGNSGGPDGNAAWLAAWPTDKYMNTVPSSMYQNYAGGDFRLTANSPARGMGTNGGDVGALPYVNPVLQLMVNPIRVGR